VSSHGPVGGRGPVPGLRHVDHVGLTVPDLDEAVAFFVDALGAEELYRSTRGPDAGFIPENFEMPADASLTLAMLRMPPNLNIELFQWSGAGLRADRPRHGDAGGHHLAFVVDDVDAAVAHLEQVPGVRILGDVKQVAGDSPRVAGNRWTYLLAPWGLMIELVDRSRVADPPRFVGPEDWKDR
jgi:catechol 2,3-dioxygenase-like lactoylglutathione lyase family enzyme